MTGRVGCARRTRAGGCSSWLAGWGEAFSRAASRGPAGGPIQTRHGPRASVAELPDPGSRTSQDLTPALFPPGETTLSPAWRTAFRRSQYIDLCRFTERSLLYFVCTTCLPDCWEIIVAQKTSLPVIETNSNRPFPSPSCCGLVFSSCPFSSPSSSHPPPLLNTCVSRSSLFSLSSLFFSLLKSLTSPRCVQWA